MKFMGDNFLLHGRTAQSLYHNYAKPLPIVDYHCHISPEEIAHDHRYDNITQMWLYGDHYKWRVMRACGTDERYITGDASDYDKFLMWAKTLPQCIGNPLYAWTHLELKRFFGYDGTLSEKTAPAVWAAAQKAIDAGGLSTRGILKTARVKLICTTDDPCDNLIHHSDIAADLKFPVKVLPAFRPDKGVNIDKPGFAAYITELSSVACITVTGLDSLKDAYRARLNTFTSLGCKAADHGLDYIPYNVMGDAEVDAILRRVLAGEAITKKEADAYKTAMLLFFAAEYKQRGIVMQLHYGAQRNLNAPMMQQLGPDTGYDAISTKDSSGNLAKLLGAMEIKDALPDMIVYPMNGLDNEMVLSVIGCFSGPQKAKMQLGSAWWFNDTKDGMLRQMSAYANYSVFGNFLGMLTDSRSFLSYTRHEYFRRILCSFVGSLVDSGEYPSDQETLGQIVRNISYYNVVRYFGFDVDDK